MVFDFYLGGYGRDNSYRAALEDSNLRVSVYQGGPLPEHDKVVSIDNNKEWEQLIRFLTSCRWDKRYDNGILDGTQWELKATGKDIAIKSYGSNAYPAVFNEFLFRLNKIVSVAGIKIDK